MNIGRAIRFSDSQIEQISQVSELDIASARSLWASTVPARYRSLLDAPTVGSSARISSPFVWDGSSRRYIALRSRRYVPFMEIRSSALESMVRAQTSALRSTGKTLQDGGSLADWQRSMIEQIKTSQTAGALVAMGGPDKLTPEDKKRIAAEIAILLLLLRQFSFDVEASRTPLNGRLLLRSDLYARAARGIFEESRRYGMGVYFGATEERRVLGRAEHCTTDEDLEGCIELSEMGWQPIGTLPRLGVSPCRSNCLCHFDYRYKDARGRWVEVDDSATVALILKQFRIKESIDE